MYCPEKGGDGDKETCEGWLTELIDTRFISQSDTGTPNRKKGRDSVPCLLTFPYRGAEEVRV